MFNWKDERVLITGGAGFIGRHLGGRLKTEGALVYLADITDTIDAPGYCHLDVTDSKSIASVFSNVMPTIVFHLASAGVTDPFLDHEYAIKANILGTLNVASAAARIGINRIVITGTSHEYGDLSQSGGVDPISIYAASKAATWSFLRAFHRLNGWPFVYLRLFQVYGPGQKNTLIPSAISHAQNHEPFYSTPGEQVRDWVFIDDVIDALMVAALLQGINGQAFDVGTCRGETVRDVLRIIYGYYPESANLPALPYRPGETWSLVASFERLLPGWKPRVSLEEGLRRTILSQVFLDKGGQQ